MRIEQPYGKRFDTELPSIDPKRKYFIACEGKKTEYKYLKSMIRSRDDLGIDPLIDVIPLEHEKGTTSHPSAIIQEATEALAHHDNYFTETDTVCIIVDRDAQSFKEHQYDEAIISSEEFPFKLIVSNPCIELWLLLHFTDLSGYNLQDILENKKQGKRTHTEILLKDDFLEGSYSKTRINFNRDFKQHLLSAITNSKKHATTLDELKNHVGTNLGLLIEEMMGF